MYQTISFYIDLIEEENEDVRTNGKINNSSRLLNLFALLMVWVWKLGIGKWERFLITLHIIHSLWKQIILIIRSMDRFECYNHSGKKETQTQIKTRCWNCKSWCLGMSLASQIIVTFWPKCMSARLYNNTKEKRTFFYKPSYWDWWKKLKTNEKYFIRKFYVLSSSFWF